MAAEEGVETAAEDAGTSTAESEGEDAGEDAAESCKTGATAGGESFTAGTKVLLASGTAVPISHLKVGEKVLATNTRTGKVEAETVTAVMVRHDTDLYDLKVRANGKTTVIDTTSNHLFWAPGSGGHGGRWVKAGALKYGTHLRTPGGGTAVAAGGWVPRQHDGWMWDLTVPGDGDHDFYVMNVEGLAAKTGAAISESAEHSAVLVHNCGIPNNAPGWKQALERDAAEKRGVTRTVLGDGSG